ncbi:hypothetical protein QRD43_20540 [Pelomonas sp. APW6]|uniref:Uncharacterized protein n=1 Tax=Roseateles subflavus TaxID=3053353 RepID=A0ABT7LQ00_9BURK|nr:hypothetical protein [Pelomonas sp. APW6]MDL5034302.1 hypothetical protein [Pelomonas sp. APW6]
METSTDNAAVERQVLDLCQAELASLRTTHPDWYVFLDDVDPDICSRTDLVELMNTAPTPGARQYLFGKFTMRIAISLITGRPFD